VVRLLDGRFLHTCDPTRSRQLTPDFGVGRVDFVAVKGRQGEGYGIIAANIRQIFVEYFVSIQPPGKLTGAFRGVVHLQTIGEPSQYNKRRSSVAQPE
jgi:hypothetical protein